MKESTEKWIEGTLERVITETYDLWNLSNKYRKEEGAPLKKEPVFTPSVMTDELLMRACPDDFKFTIRKVQRQEVTKALKRMVTSGTLKTSWALHRGREVRAYEPANLDL